MWVAFMTLSIKTILPLFWLFIKHVFWTHLALFSFWFLSLDFSFVAGCGQVSSPLLLHRVQASTFCLFLAILITPKSLSLSLSQISFFPRMKMNYQHKWLKSKRRNWKIMNTFGLLLGKSLYTSTWTVQSMHSFLWCLFELRTILSSVDYSWGVHNLRTSITVKKKKKKWTTPSKEEVKWGENS